MAVSGNVICIDFDGTVVTHEYPHMGEDNGAVPVLKELVANKNRLVLHTMRSGRLLDRAKQWFADRDIPLWAINANPEQKQWTDSPKIYANLYIDDSALGMPLKYEIDLPRPYVDWQKTRAMLVDYGLLEG